MNKHFWTKEALDLELLVVTDLLQLNSLHYGYWKEQPRSINLPSVREAQNLYTDTLMEFLPKSVCKVLDIGSGVGDIAAAIASRGLKVTAISPDKNHVRFLEKLPKEMVKFHNTTIQEFHSDKKFDLVLMSESQDYFPMDVGLSKSREYLTDDGYLLISGQFRNSDTPEFGGCHIEQDYVELAKQYGFELLERIDITKNVLPTLDYASEVVDDFFIRPYSVLTKHAKGNLRFKLWLIKLFFRKQIKQFLEIKSYYDIRFNSNLYNERMSYVRLLFKKTIKSQTL